MEKEKDQQQNNRKEAELDEALQLWEEMRKVDKTKGWNRLMADIQMKNGRKKQRSLRFFRSIAAVIILFLLLGGAGALWLMPEKVAQEVIAKVGDDQPRLILEDGRQIVLGQESGSETTVEKQCFRINREEKSIVYVSRGSSPTVTLEYNTLEIPRGAEYELILADGTHVWLNAETRLRYPVNFGKDERRVYLEGEAYFQVTKDGSRPFRVESVTQTVEVLGTQFNVYAYGDEQQVYTTLVEGKVTVTSLVSGKQFGLSPGEQAVTKLHNGDISIHKVNVDQVIGWKNGMFVFDDQNLETILRKVERWYNIEIFYKNNAAKAKVFKGNLPRYGELQELLRVLESGSQVRFSLKGRSLTVE